MADMQTELGTGWLKVLVFLLWLSLSLHRLCRTSMRLDFWQWLQVRLWTSRFGTLFIRHGTMWQ